MNKEDDIPALFTKNQKMEKEVTNQPSSVIADGQLDNSQILAVQYEQAVDVLLNNVLLLALPSPSIHFH